MISPYLLQDNRPLAKALRDRAATQRRDAAIVGASDGFKARARALAQAYEAAAAKAEQGIFPFDNDNAP